MLGSSLPTRCTMPCHASVCSRLSRAVLVLSCPSALSQWLNSYLWFKTHLQCCLLRRQNPPREFSLLTQEELTYFFFCASAALHILSSYPVNHVLLHQINCGSGFPTRLWAPEGERLCLSPLHSQNLIQRLAQSGDSVNHSSFPPSPWWQWLSYHLQNFSA